MKKFIVHSRVKDAIIHPFAFAVFPVLSLFVQNMGKRECFHETLEIAAGILVFAVLSWLFMFFFVKDMRKSALIVSVFFVLFFFYGHAISASSTVLERLHLLDKARFLVEGKSALRLWLVAWGVLFVAASYFTTRLTSDLRLATEFLNVVGLTLVIMVGVSFFTADGFNTFLMPRVREVLAHTDSKETDTGVSEFAGVLKFKVFLPLVAHEELTTSGFTHFWQKDMALESLGTASSSSPDIYYIILDMYARADYLEEIYHYDDSEFLSFLTGKGFYVASKSRSNYPYTAHSFASSLNFVYLDEAVNLVGERYTDSWPSIKMVRENSLVQYLRNRGYTIVTFSTGYEFTEIRDADVYMEPDGWHPSEFQSTLVNTTPLATILKNLQEDLHRERVLYTFDHIADATRIDSPTFVFAHVLVPHSPFVFGPNGEPVKSKSHYERDQFIEAYRNQVAFASKRMQTVIEEILSQSPEPPVIIVQSDHGPCFGHYHLNIPERMSILNAYYFPERNYEALYESITPVNTFRVVLNEYFGADLELLEDRSYFSTWDFPYSFTDVTDEVLAGPNTVVE